MTSAWIRICAACEEGLDIADVVESNSTRSGHRDNVGIAGQLVIQYCIYTVYIQYIYIYIYIHIYT